MSDDKPAGGPTPDAAAPPGATSGTSGDTTRPATGGADPLTARKQAIRQVLMQLAELAEGAGLTSTARDIRDTRVPKLDDERFSLVVLGEFNHGKSTLINALIGETLLPSGITPTSAVLAHLRHGPTLAAESVLEDGTRRALSTDQLASWLTVDGQTANPTAGLHHVEIQCPARVLEDGVVIVDTPGVNDINQQRAEITYGYVPRADAIIFLLDGTQILTASERQFLEERILRSARDRLVFVVGKVDLLDDGELDETLAFARKHLGAIVPEPTIFPVSARRALGQARAKSGIDALLTHLGATLGADRRRLVLDHALGDAGRLAAFVRQSLGMRRRSLELPVDDLEQRIARARERLNAGKRALDEAADTIRAETAGLKARVRQDLAEFTGDFKRELAPELESADADDIRRYLPFFIQDTWKSWAEQEGQRIAAELERLAEAIIQVANENVGDVARAVSAELGLEDTRLSIQVDTLKYDASVFALGALGTTIFLFVNTFVGGMLTLGAPLLALILRGRVAKEIRAEASQRAPEAVDRAAAALGPRLDEMIDDFASRLSEFVAQAGDALARGITEVLDRALSERKGRAVASDASADVAAIDGTIAALTTLDERITEIRQAVWDPAAPAR